MLKNYDEILLAPPGALFTIVHTLYIHYSTYSDDDVNQDGDDDEVDADADPGRLEEMMVSSIGDTFW